MKNILIIKCGELYPLATESIGTVESWIIRQSNLPENVFRVYNIAEGEQPYHPSEYMAAIITGSHANVNQRLDWIKQLKDWIVTARYSNLPVLGICFGHQILAEALGGKATMDSNGPHAGIVEIQLESEGKADPLFKNLAPSFESYTAHAFSVSELPLGAEVLASSSEGVVESFKVDKIRGVQFHPEYDETIAKIACGHMKLLGESTIGLKLKNSYKNQSIIPNFLDLALKF